MVQDSFEPAAEARRLSRTARWAALATLDRQVAGPYASLVSVATDIDGAPLLLISRLAVHTRNLEVDPLCSLLYAEVGAGDPMVHPRVSFAGSATRLDDPSRARRRFLARHPAAALYADFADFSFWRVEPRSAHLVAGFGRIVDLAPADLLVDLSDASDLVAAEEEAVAHVNADHAGTLRLYATRLLGLPDGDWTMTGLDPEGCDLALGDQAARLRFPQRVRGPGPLRAVLRDLAEQARATEA